MIDAEEMTLLTISKGSLPEIFAVELAKVIANMADLNTKATAPRKITISITFKPFADRSGVEIDAECDCKLAKLDTSGAKSTAFLAKRNGKFALFTRDLRQELLFDGTDGKSAAAGETQRTA